MLRILFPCLWIWLSQGTSHPCSPGQGFQLGFNEGLKVRVRSSLPPRSLFSIAGTPEWSEMGKKWGYSRPSRLAAFVYSQSLVKLPAILPEDAYLPRRLIYLYYTKGAFCWFQTFYRTKPVSLVIKSTSTQGTTNCIKRGLLDFIILFEFFLSLCLSLIRRAKYLCILFILLKN